ncbi:MAG: hypothetical protein ACUVSX_03845 [Aggregatilineales bacterium]
MKPFALSLSTLSEDWQATLIGLAIVAAIGLGLIGPGPQTVTLKAGNGAAAEMSALAASGWKISATLDGDKIDVAGGVSALAVGSLYAFACRDGAVALEAAAVGDGQPRLTLINDCAGEVVVTLKRAGAIPWPLFGWFAR